MKFFVLVLKLLFFRSPNDIEACFIKYNASGVPHFGLLVEIIINALRASLISVLLLLTLIRLISLLQIYFKNHSVALISGFNLFRDRFSLSLLNKVPRVPKCSSALVAKCPSAFRVPEGPSAGEA